MCLGVLCLQARKQPTSQAGVIEYLLSTETGEMQYETARCRPQLDASFFTYLDRQVGGCTHDLWSNNKRGGWGVVTGEGGVVKTLLDQSGVS